MSCRLLAENGNALITEAGDNIVLEHCVELGWEVVCNLSPAFAKWPIARAFIYKNDAPPSEFVWLEAPDCLYPKARYVIYDWSEYALNRLTALTAGVYDGSGRIFLPLIIPPPDIAETIPITHPPLPVPAGDYILCVTANIDGDDRQYPGSW